MSATSTSELMLHGIIFVVHLSIGGDKLVFRYPHVTRTQVSQETLVAFKQSTTKSSLHPDSVPDSSSTTTPPNGGGTGERPNRPGDQPTDSKERQQQGAGRTSTNWYNTPSVLLAPILMPKAQMCDRSFDVTIDDTRFIGHPSLVQKKVAEEAKLQNEQQQQQDNESDRENNYNSDNNENKLTKAPKNESNNNNSNNEQSRINGSDNDSSKKFNNNNSNHDDNTSLSNNSNHNNANDTSYKQPNGNSTTDNKRTGENGKNTDGNEEEKQGDRKKQDQKDDLRLFNIVFAVPSTAASQRANRFKWMAAQIASALLHEQSRCGYLLEQVNIMSAIRDEWLLEQTRKIAEASQSNAPSANKKDTNSSSSSTSTQSNPNASTSTSIGSPYFPRDDNASSHKSLMTSGHSDLTLRLLKASRLACELRDIFVGISNGNPAHAIRFNNWVTVPLSLQDPNAHSLFPLRPYHTLLLLDTQTHDSQIDRLPALKRLMEAAKPTKTFRELQIETDIPLAQMYRMAAHLVFWGRAKIINIMTKNNIYILSPHNMAISNNLPALWREFSKAFPYFNLVEVLASFSVPKPLEEHVRLLRSGYTHYRDFVLVVTWLLQKDLIVQLHTYVHLMLPKEPEGNVSTSRLSYSTSPMHSTYKYTPPYPSCPQPLQSDELLLLEKLDDGTSTYQLLRRLAPYFRGRHTIEEIMWRENVPRDQLTKLFQKHKNILVRVVHEGSNSNKEIMGNY